MSDHKEKKRLPKHPYKVLEAPGLIDDYYLNLLDWSYTGLLSIGIKDKVYVWSNTKSKISKLCSYDGGIYVGAVNWSKYDNQIAVGKSDGKTDIYDAVTNKLTATFDNHTDRVSVLSWDSDLNCPHLIASGSKDSMIALQDIRTQSNCIKLDAHLHEVCGLKFSFDGGMLASGGNDNLMFVWDIRKLGQTSSYLFKTEQHKAAVKAIAWSPLQRHLLASGGGSHDQTIRLWNISSQSIINSIYTGTQICNLVFSKSTNEFISTHGYSQNQINIWDVSSPKLTCNTGILTGHSSRVLYLTISPDGETIATAAGQGDETIRFWNIFPRQSTKKDVFDFNDDLNIR